MKPVCQLTRSSLIWLMASIVLLVAPFFGMIPIWLYGLAMLTIAWRLGIHSGRLNFPHWTLRGLMVVAVVIGLMIQARQGTTIQLTVALLVAAFLLKLTEMYQRRDALVVIFVGFLLCGCIFLFYQSIPAAIYVLLVMVVLTAALNTVYRSEQHSELWPPLRRAGIMYLQAAPMMLVLFLIFPRLPPLWQVDMDTGQRFTGLSDSMAPGDVSNLTRSAQIAFRARFDGAVPPDNERYWRGIVYDYFDGQRWQQSTQPEGMPALIPGNHRGAPLYRYELIMEPTGQYWRYGLDLPVSFPGSLRMNHDLTLTGSQPLMNRTQLMMTSRTGQVVQNLSLAQSVRYLQLPERGNEQARILARQWRKDSQNPGQYIEAMLAFFSAEFTYTLQPPRLFNDQVDTFLFETQRGFCGHFAGSAVFLLRAAGIPARVVGGYQGGEVNPEDGVMTVRQYAAHAWVEYWDGGAWQRLDPTAVVAPDRLEQPLDELFRDQPGFLADSLLFRSGAFSSGWLKQLRQQYEALNFSWHHWVLNFHNQQHGLLRSLLGDISWQRLLLLLMVPVALVLMAVAAQLLYRRRPTADPVLRALQQLDRKLGPRQQRATGETVQQHMQRLAGLYPPLAEQWLLLGRYHEQICYQEDRSPVLQQRFLEQLKHCYDRLPRLADRTAH